MGAPPIVPARLKGVSGLVRDLSGLVRDLYGLVRELYGLGRGVFPVRTGPDCLALAARDRGGPAVGSCAGFDACSSAGCCTAADNPPAGVGVGVGVGASTVLRVFIEV